MADNYEMTEETSDAESPMEDASEKNTVMLSSDMFGDVNPTKGARITFCVTSDPDSEGNIAGYFMGDGGEKKDTWEDGLRSEMSPMNSEDNSQ